MRNTTQAERAARPTFNELKPTPLGQERDRYAPGVSGRTGAVSELAEITTISSLPPIEVPPCLTR